MEKFCKNIKLPGIISVAVMFGFIYWFIDAIVSSLFSSSKSTDLIWETFINDLQTTPDIYSRLVAIILLVLLGLISFINRKQITFQNAELSKLKNKLERTNKKLRQFLFKDYLTGAINKKPFIALLDKRVSIAQRANESFAVLFIDMAKFKNLNDTYGHNFGDEILAYTSYKLSECIRKSDFMGRYGGDEFIICLNNITTKDNINKGICPSWSSVPVFPSYNQYLFEN